MLLSLNLYDDDYYYYWLCMVIAVYTVGDFRKWLFEHGSSR